MATLCYKLCHEQTIDKTSPFSAKVLLFVNQCEARCCIDFRHIDILKGFLYLKFKIPSIHSNNNNDIAEFSLLFYFQFKFR